MPTRTLLVGPSGWAELIAAKRCASVAKAPADKAPAAVDLRKHRRDTWDIAILLL